MGLEELSLSHIRNYPRSTASLLRNSLWYEHDGKLVVPEPRITSSIDVPSIVYDWIENGKERGPLDRVIPLNGLIVPFVQREKRFLRKPIDSVCIRDESSNKELLLTPTSIVYGEIHSLGNCNSYENMYWRRVVDNNRFYLKNLLRIGQKNFNEHGFYTVLKLK